ncbi:7-cyano-7-deazaguanine synthase QueC [Candidatus Thioglobus sp.]|jgi:7-cyano-7-deazaguanine synthase|uniref:7-cyano-7-deazaguanine synthase QueC n=1 Tax=Candidatus Thioglobus sp. TaxID=2026721 RepID=UPI001DD6CF9A|nr:7-cyano-7-deazaguanine synthase QueC [Candidatus Thioglobus sp.]MBT3276536.1 7-cyano-7-deazaguanine synthase QueC [Candidatus Thioglobus sp.]MBT3446643.1 7-cyano-7-deazaguanine synthase QueC [Candidatus Thioglobus sp.]MBT3744975.1 7-cyano-7-deazaguanine synthase QueC [Candidatus Thioglobus sp.]MBT4001046.1 7-cyano-7-deazaguanine synthase QueC [Candidatus Thioglobus sp.]MBT4181692.1 7-cyano-7-deazaguanine synthase QueC [Candidatus Thioglobus sp.]
MSDAKPKAVVLLSGGLDSTTTLAIAKSQGFECFALSFDYGQKQKSELVTAANVAKIFNATEHRIMKISLSDIGGSALTDDNIDVPDFKESDEIPITYVPARNTIFLSYALAWSEVLDCQHIFIGVNALDYSGYPDCRQEYIDAFSVMANLATKQGVEGQKINIQTPLINLSKAQIIQQGVALGVDYANTTTCYQANENGEACGVCDACEYRKIGFFEAKIKDPTRYQA